jgi:putative heme transporter
MGGQVSPAPLTPGQDEGPPHRLRTLVRVVLLLAVVALVVVELVLGWPTLSSALSQLRTPHPGWVAAAVVVEVASMGAYARMQRSLLRSAGVRVSVLRHVALAYAAHSLSVTLPGGPAFSTRFNFQQMRRFGASPAVASWCIALSGILSAAALTVVTAVGAIAAHGTFEWRSVAGFAVAAVLVGLAVRRVRRHPEALQSVTRTVLAALNRVRRQPAGQGIDDVRGFVDQLRSTRLTPRHAVAAAWFATANWLFDALCLWLCFHAVAGGTIGPTQVLLAYCAGMAAASIPIVPGGLGVIDSALVLGLVAGGVPTATAIAAVVLYRVISFGFIIGVGWVLWLVIRHRTRQTIS